MITTSTPDTSHLKAGMKCTIRFRHPDDWNRTTEPVTGTLEDVFGVLYLGATVVRLAGGVTSEKVAEVVDPAPPKVWPVGTRLTDGQVRAVLTNDGSETRWFVYDGEGYGTDEFGPTWRADTDVADWTPVEDDRPEVVDLPDGVELAHDEDGDLWVRRAWRMGGVEPWMCLTTILKARSDAEAANWTRVAVTPSRALPDGHVPIDLRQVPAGTLREIIDRAYVVVVDENDKAGLPFHDATEAVDAACRAELARRRKL